MNSFITRPRLTHTHTQSAMYNKQHYRQEFQRRNRWENCLRTRKDSHEMRVHVFRGKWKLKCTFHAQSKQTKICLNSKLLVAVCGHKSTEILNFLSIIYRTMIWLFFNEDNICIGNFEISATSRQNTTEQNNASDFAPIECHSHMKAAKASH